MLCVPIIFDWYKSYHQTLCWHDAIRMWYKKVSLALICQTRVTFKEIFLKNLGPLLCKPSPKYVFDVIEIRDLIYSKYYFVTTRSSNFSTISLCLKLLYEDNGKLCGNLRQARHRSGSGDSFYSLPLFLFSFSLYNHNLSNSWLAWGSGHKPAMYQGCYMKFKYNSNTKW